MISKKRILVSFPFILIILFLALSGCGSPSPQATPTSTPELGIGLSPTATPTPGISVGPGQPDLPIDTCPSEKTLYSLWFSHLAVLELDAGDGEKFYLKFENIPPSYFDLWIEPDGQISNEGIFREAPIGYNGTFTHPKDADCPVQTFAGTWQMRAKITGTCDNNVARIHIVEEWLNPVLVSDCGGGDAPAPGTVSAPELDLVLDLNDSFPADGIQIPEGGIFHASYAYVLYPAGYELPIVPLVPEK